MRIISIACLFVLIGCTAQQTVPNENAGLKYNPKAAEINVQLGANYIASENYLAADEKLQRALKQNPKYSKAYWVSAILQEKLEQIDIAEQYYRKAIQIDAKDSAAMYNYATFLCRHKRYQESVKYYRQTLADPLYPSRAAAFLRAGLCAMEIPDYEAAEYFLSKTVSLQNDQRVALYQLAKLSFNTNDLVQAKQHMTKFESVSEHTLNSLWLAYQIDHKLGDNSSAKHYADSLRQHYPDSKETKLLAESVDESTDR